MYKNGGFPKPAKITIIRTVKSGRNVRTPATEAKPKPTQIARSVSMREL
jgi:hypothetical protein